MQTDHWRHLVTMDEQTTFSQTGESLNTVVPEVDFMLYHAQDGTPLANYIKQRFSDKRLMCTVQTKDFDSACKSNTRKTDPNVAKVTVIIVSPIMLSLLPHLKPFAKDLFPIPEMSVVLCIQTNVDKVADLMNRTVEEFEKWTTCLIEDNRASFRNCLVTIMTMLEDYDTEPLPTMKLFHIVPSTINSNTEKIHVLFTKEIHGQVEVRYCDDVIPNVMYNPYTVVFSPPVQPPSSAVIEITINGVSMGTDTVLYLSKKEEICQLLYDVINPLEFLSETLFCEKVSSEEDLDGKLAAVMEEDIKLKSVDAFRLVEHTKWDDYPTRQEQPTLLHLAAKLGLRKLAAVLLKMPGAVEASCMLNSTGWSAEDIARMSGHTELADDIKKFKKHVKDRHYYTEKEAIYVDMKKTMQKTRTSSDPVSPVSPPLPTSPRPNTDPKFVRGRTSFSSKVHLNNSLDNVDEEAPVLRRQESKSNGTIIEYRSSQLKLLIKEKKRSARLTLLIDENILSAHDHTSERAEREYATIGEIFEDLKPFLSISDHKRNTRLLTTEKPSLMALMAPNNQMSAQDKTFEMYSVCKVEQNTYDTPPPMSRRK